MRFVLTLLCLVAVASPAQAQLAAAVLPSSRAVQVGAPATAYATVLNGGAVDATGCSIAPATVVSADFFYQTTNGATNQPTGTRNTPATITAHGSQTFIIGFTPTAPIGGIALTDVTLNFTC